MINDLLGILYTLIESNIFVFHLDIEAFPLLAAFAWVLGRADEGKDKGGRRKDKGIGDG